MASLLRFPAESGPFYIKFRFGGRQHKYGLKHYDQVLADETHSRVERTLRDLDEGRLVVPEGADIVEFVKTDGGRAKKLDPQQKGLTVRSLFDLYKEKLTPGSKMARTSVTDHIHGRHLAEILGANRSLTSLAEHGALQEYIDKRIRQKYRGRHIRPYTVRKELKTLGAVWRWAYNQGLTKVTFPEGLSGKLKFPKETAKPRFQTWAEIERHIARGKPTEREQQELWECLFLDTKQVEEVLNFVEAKITYPWLYLAVLFVAHTGARRSEMVRSEVGDFDFDHGIVKIRERKHAGGDLTFRQVPMSGRLRRVFQEAFVLSKDRFAVSMDYVRAEAFRKASEIEDYVTYAGSKATRAFRDVLDKDESKWSVLHGFHVFRHSFISNMAKEGIDQRVIDDMVGHETEEMKLRYRHLFPEVRQTAISRLFG